MKIRKIWTLLITASLLLIGILYFTLRLTTSEQTITKELYDDLYYQQQTWSITQFPNNNANYTGSDYAWGWSYIGNSLIDMYKATGDEKYLEFFVSQAEFIFTQTDEKLGVESFTGTGLSLPAWSDRAHYTSGKYNYIYPVHTGMIAVPILRFVDTVKSGNIKRFEQTANDFLESSGKALTIHNEDDMWKDFSKTEGFYIGHPYGEGIVSEANKIGVPNRISIYLAAIGLYDKITGGKNYTKRIEKSLNYFKYSLIKYDEEFDSYYWSYWEELNKEKPWEDISHATITVYGLYILQQEVGFTVFTDDEFKKFANIIHKIINDKHSPPQMRKTIHENYEDKKKYYTSDENKYYYSIFGWSFLGVYDKDVLELLQKNFEEIESEMSITLKLRYISEYLSTKEKIEEKGFFH